jgi:hypothetical protein
MRCLRQGWEQERRNVALKAQLHERCSRPDAVQRTMTSRFRTARCERFRGMCDLPSLCDAARATAQLCGGTRLCAPVMQQGHNSCWAPLLVEFFVVLNARTGDANWLGRDRIESPRRWPFTACRWRRRRCKVTVHRLLGSSPRSCRSSPATATQTAGGNSSTRRPHRQFDC